MPSLEATPIALPFSGSVPLSRHCSHQGALHASERCGRQAVALLSLYRADGPLTDVQAAKGLSVERTTICARRNELVRLGLVRAVDSIKGEHGISNTRWGL